MNKRADVLDCLIRAIAEQTGAVLAPGDLNTATPEALGYVDGLSWLRTLDDTADRLRAKGYRVQSPTRAKAGALRAAVLTASQLYLESLTTIPAKAAATRGGKEGQ